MLDHPDLPEMTGQRKEWFSFIYFDPNSVRFCIVAADKWQFMKPPITPSHATIYPHVQHCFTSNQDNSQQEETSVQIWQVTFVGML